MGQPGYNFWWSIQDFGYLYLEYNYKYTSTKVMFGYKFMAVHRKTASVSVFGCPATFLVVPHAGTTKIVTLYHKPLVKLAKMILRYMPKCDSKVH